MDLISHNCSVKLTWLTELGVTVKCMRGIIAFYVGLCHYIIVVTPWMSSATCKLYVYRTQKHGLYMPFSGWLSWARQLQVTFVLCTANCALKNRRTPDKQSDMARMIAYIRYYQHFLEEGKLVAFVACVESRHYPPRMNTVRGYKFFRRPSIISLPLLFA